MTAPATAHRRDRDVGVRQVRVGSVTVQWLVQFHYRVHPLRFFPDIDPALLGTDAWYWRPPYCEDGLMVIDVGGFVVRADGRTILVDAGVGNGKPRPNPLFDARDDDWFATWRRAGVVPEEIDTVVFTHLHADHVGFATRFDGSAWVPAFPRARYLTTAPELEYWTGPAALDYRTRLGDYLADSVLPLRDAGVLDLVRPDLEITDEVRLVPAAGHTPGNVAVEIRSEGRRALFTGDIVHHAVQLAVPDLSTDYCVDSPGASRARRAVLESVADTDDLVFPAHFPHGAPGRIRSDGGGGYRFEPVDGEPA